jgi:hypothetical protein
MTQKRKRGRPTKPVSERKSCYVALPLERARLDLYKEAAEKGFKGNRSAFLRAAADALAAQLTATEKRETREREASRGTLADVGPEQFEQDRPVSAPHGEQKHRPTLDSISTWD